MIITYEIVDKIFDFEISNEIVNRIKKWADGNELLWNIVISNKRINIIPKNTESETKLFESLVKILYELKKYNIEIKGKLNFDF